MPRPNPFPCGGQGQPACPPEPAAVTNEPALYTLSDMQAHGFNCYQKGKLDALLTHHAGDNPVDS